MNGSHSIIAPSSAGIFGPPDGCTAYPIMALQHPEVEATEESREGEATHELAEGMIREASRGGGNTFQREKIINTQATNGVLVNDEMYDGAKLYADICIELMRSTGVFGGVNLGIERRVHAPRIHELSAGTPDFFLYQQHDKILHIIDFKFGYLDVDVYENYQLINYFEGICNELNINDDQNIMVHFKIVQPRSYNGTGKIKQWIVNAAELRPHINSIHFNVTKALNGQGVIKTGRHCRDCCARLHCKPAIDIGVQLFEIASKPIAIDLNVHQLSNQLSIVREAIERLTYLDKALSVEVEHTIKRGDVVPGWTIEPGRVVQKWSDDISIDDVLMMGMNNGHNLAKPMELITPNKAKSLGIDTSVIKQYTKEVNQTSKLKPVSANKIKRAFK